MRTREEIINEMVETSARIKAITEDSEKIIAESEEIIERINTLLDKYNNIGK